MSKFADGYSRYLTDHFNYINKYKAFRKYFRNSIILSTDPNFMSKTLIDNKESFPKYPYFLNVFARTDSINLVKIFDSAMDNTNELVESMLGVEELGKKKLYDSIPFSLDNFLTEINFQFAYISTPTDLYNYELIIKSFITEYQYRNFFSDLYAPLFYSSDQVYGETSGLEDKSFLYQYMLYSSLYNSLLSSHNIYSKSLMYLTYINDYGAVNDRVDQQSILTGFQTFVTNYSGCMSTDLASIIGKSIYNFQRISNKMLQDLKNVISVKINDVTTGLYKSFYNFYNPLLSLAPINFLCGNFTQQLNAFVASDVVSKIYSDNNIIDQEATNQQVIYEDDEYEIYMEKITESQMKNYLFLCFLYKFWPIKFLNVLQLSMKEYVENLIKSPADDLMTEIQYGDLFKYFVNSFINYTNLQSFLSTHLTPEANIITYGSSVPAEFTFTPGMAFVVCSNLESYNAVNLHEYIFPDGDVRANAVHVVSKLNPGTLTLVIENEYGGPISTANVQAYRYTYETSNYMYNVSALHEIPEFACINYYIYLLEEYLKSENYNTFIEELVETIFVYLRDNGHVDYSFDWYEYHDVARVYFKTFLRWKILDQSRRGVLTVQTNARYKFTNGNAFVYCGDKESYDLIVDGDYIFSEQDTIDNAVEVLSHSIIGSDYVLNLSSLYSGQSTNDMYTVGYTFSPTDVPLFNNVTLNFSNKLIPRVLLNSTADPNFDIDILIQSDESLRGFFATFSTFQSINRSMHIFSENLMLSTLTRETIYSAFSNFV